MSTRKTPWFPPHVHPVRPGVYETKSPSLGNDPGWYSYWNGKQWGSASPFPDYAYGLRKSRSPWQNRAWRGLKESA